MVKVHKTFCSCESSERRILCVLHPRVILLARECGVTRPTEAAGLSSTTTTIKYTYENPRPVAAYYRSIQFYIRRRKRDRRERSDRLLETIKQTLSHSSEKAQRSRNPFCSAVPLKTQEQAYADYVKSEKERVRAANKTCSLRTRKKRRMNSMQRFRSQLHQKLSRDVALRWVNYRNQLREEYARCKNHILKRNDAKYRKKWYDFRQHFPGLVPDVTGPERDFLNGLIVRKNVNIVKRKDMGSYPPEVTKHVLYEKEWFDPDQIGRDRYKHSNNTQYSDKQGGYYNQDGQPWVSREQHRQSQASAKERYYQYFDQEQRQSNRDKNRQSEWYFYDGE